MKNIRDFETLKRNVLKEMKGGGRHASQCPHVRCEMQNEDYCSSLMGYPYCYCIGPYCNYR